MSFISLEFLCLLGVVLLVCSRLAHRAQNLFLIAASYLFYGWWDWRFLGLILVSSLVDYLCGIGVDRQRSPELSDKKRKLVMLVSILVNLSVLGFFKYYGFFVESLKVLANSAGIPLGLNTLDIILPVGISFYTFQSLSYTIDVYRGSLRSTPRIDDFLLYVAFFPQLVAGPIERATHLMPQVQNPRTISFEKITDGAQLMLFGFFKKMVIADNLAIYVDSVYGSAHGPHGLSVVLATYAFAFQIYADFSGYTDIARGCARMLGFELRTNFWVPYLATSPSDFWRRWHTSLSSWLRDYLYIPLGGNRGGKFATYRNLFLTMLLGGLWHGAAYHYVLWGAFHGVILIVFLGFDSRESRSKRSTDRPGPMLFALKAFAFFQLTCLGWLLFRAQDVSQVLDFLTAIARWTSPVSTSPVASSLLLVAIYVLPLFLFDLYRHCNQDPEPWKGWSLLGQVVFILTLFYGIVLLGAPHGTSFLYFQF